LTLPKIEKANTFFYFLTHKYREFTRILLNRLRFFKIPLLVLMFLLPVLSFAGVCSEGTVISKIELRGLEHTRERVVLRELQTHEGDTFSRARFDAEKLRLQDLDLFTEIRADCEGGVLRYRFKEIFRWIPAPAGKTTDRDGIMAGLALANLNVLGEDIRAEVQYRSALNHLFKNNEYAFYASSPYLLGLPLGWNFEFLRTDSWDDLRSFQDDSYLADLDLDYQVTPKLSLLGTVAFRYLEAAAGLPEAGLGFAFDFRDSKLDTRKGVYFEYMLTHVGYGDDSDSDCSGELCDNMGGENYWEFLTDARAYFTVGRFITGANALIRVRPGDVERYDYYYHGGTNTFRGHDADSNSLGVHETLLNLEERFVLRERKAASLWDVNFFYGLQLVVGFDGSLLWDKGSPSWNNYEGAIYGGLHLVIPALDRIRLEVGYSPDRGEPVFYFGLFDKTISQRWRSR